MENHRYYVALVERIFFEGIDANSLEKVAGYKEGKSFQDLKEAVRLGLVEGPFEAGSQLGCIASRLKEVLDIRPAEISFHEYKDKLRAM
ncbi:MAG: hypothetical protein AABX23_01580 [Nanoarchaeota archaeon]